METAIQLTILLKTIYIAHTDTKCNIENQQQKYPLESVSNTSLGGGVWFN